MKKTISLLVFGQLIFAQGLYTQNKIPNIDLTKNIILKTSTNTSLTSFDLNNKEFIITDSNKLKIFDINSQELIKSIPSKEIKKAQISSDNSKLLVLTKDALFIVNNKNYKIISTLKGDYSNFDEKGNILVLTQNGYKKHTQIFNLSNGQLISNISKYYITKVSISPNIKKIALSYDDKVYIYDLHGNLLNTIKTPNRIHQIDWMDNKHILVLEGYAKAIKYDVVTSKITAQTPIYKYADRFVILNPNNIFIGEDNKGYIFNFIKNKITKTFNLPENQNIRLMKLYNNLLAVGYYNNAYLFKTNLKTNYQIKSIKKASLPTKEKIVTKIVEKKVYIKEHKNIKPTLEIYASKTEGFTPLKVDFKIIANDEDGKIISYYINFAGKEALGKGNPTKPFSYTFENPGNYKIIVAVKDNNGAITTKQITIKVREENFNDFKKGLMRN